MKRYVGLFGRLQQGVLPFLAEDFERRGYVPVYQRTSVFTPDQVDRRFELVATVGLRGRALDVRDAYRNHGVETLVTDTVHLRRDWKRYHKVVIGEQHWIPPFACPEDRLDELNLELVESGKGEAILVCGQKADDSQHSMSGHQLKSWVRQVIDSLRRATDREIVWRPHPLDVYQVPNADRTSDPREEPIQDALEDAHALVSYNSTAGLDALIAGVPAYAFGPCVYSELAEPDFEGVDEAEVPSIAERRELLSRVAYTQWTADEIKRGRTLDFLLPILAGESPSFAGAEGVAVEADQEWNPPLPPRLCERLEEHGINSRDALFAVPREEVAGIKGIGPKRLDALYGYAIEVA